MMKKSALGRNLDVLLNRGERSTANVATLEKKVSVAIPKEGQLRQLPTELLQRGRYQPRREISLEAVKELADSIRAQGVIQPIVVRAISADRYEIIAGERRWRAAQLAGLTEIPAIIKDISDESTLAVALIENIQRENLNAMEEAIALQRLVDEFDMTHQQVAEAVGKSRTTITNLLRLLDLHADVRHFVEQGKLEMGHARALLALEGKTQIDAARLVMLQGLSVRETEQLVKRLNANGKDKKDGVKALDPNVRALQQNLSEKLGATVSLQQNAKGKGKLQIHYNSLDELDGILERIK